jgi:hypothetical protein
MTGPITANHAPAPAVASRPDHPTSSAGRDAAIPATGADIEIPVTGLQGLPPRRFAAPLTAAVALVLAVTAALIFVAVVRGLAPAPSGHQAGTPILVPHPAPGPFGS